MPIHVGGNGLGTASATAWSFSTALPLTPMAPREPTYFGGVCGSSLGEYTSLWNNRLLAAFQKVEVV